MLLVVELIAVHVIVQLYWSSTGAWILSILSACAGIWLVSEWQAHRISQCANDAIARFDPSREEFVGFRLPTRVAFIRHLDIDPQTGDVWAAYSHSPGLDPRIVRLQVH